MAMMASTGVLLVLETVFLKVATVVVAVVVPPVPISMAAWFVLWNHHDRWRTMVVTRHRVNHSRLLNDHWVLGCVAQRHMHPSLVHGHCPNGLSFGVLRHAKCSCGRQCGSHDPSCGRFARAGVSLFKRRSTGRVHDQSPFQCCGGSTASV
jgi:hypothetical protein